MKCVKSGSFPKLREHFRNSEEIGLVINRGKRTVMDRFKTGFTEKEQILILQHLGLEDTRENRKEVFS